MWQPKDWDWMQKNIPILCVDGIVVNDDGEILLSKRSVEPFKDFWHIPGGVVNYRESTKQAIYRVMQSETGLEVAITSLLGVYSDPKRDPRGHFVTVAYLLKSVGGALVSDEKSSALAYFAQLPASMGFDAEHIARDAFARL